MKIIINEDISVDIRLKKEGQMSLEELDSLVQITRPMMKANREVINLEDIDTPPSLVTTEEVKRNHHKQWKNGIWAKWTDAKKQKFATDLKSGMKYKDLANKYHISFPSICHFKIKLGITGEDIDKSEHPKNDTIVARRWTPELAQQFWDDSKWMTIKEMESKYQMTYHMVSKTKGKIKRGNLNQECKGKVRL